MKKSFWDVFRMYTESFLVACDLIFGWIVSALAGNSLMMSHDTLRMWKKLMVDGLLVAFVSRQSVRLGLGAPENASLIRRLRGPWDDGPSYLVVSLPS